MSIKPKSNGAYAPLAADYFRDDAILEAGEAAELLYVRCLSFCANSASDGFITERQLKLVVAIGMEAISERIEALLSTDLLVQEDGGYVVRSWLKWNKTADEIGKHLKQDRERKRVSRESERTETFVQTESVRTPDGIQSPIQSNAIQNTTTTLDEPSEVFVYPNDFEKFYAAYPRKTGKRAAFTKWQSLIRSKVVRWDVIVAGAERFAADPNLPKDANFIPHPATWLNAGRWEDEALPERLPEVGTSNYPTPPGKLASDSSGLCKKHWYPLNDCPKCEEAA